MKLLLIGFLFPLLTSIQALAMDDGNELFDKCRQAELSLDDKDVRSPVSAGNCLGYLEGVRHGLQVFADKNNGMCLPKNGVINGQALKILMKYLRENPADLNESAFLLIFKSLRISFPCGK